MIVSMWMSRKVLTVTPDSLLTEAATLMTAKQVRRLLVVKAQPEGMTLLGILSQGDLFRAFPSEINPFSVVAAEAYRSHTTVREVMHHHPISTAPDAPIELAARIMRDHKIGALPVVQHGLVVGIITESDIFRAFVELFAAQQDEVRITFDASKEEDTLEAVVNLAARHNVQVVSLLTSEHDGRHIGVVRVTGKAIERFESELWRSGHPVLNILRTP